MKFVGLVLGAASIVMMWRLTENGLVWRWMGYPDQTYPELLYFLYGLPAAIVATIAGGHVAVRLSQNQRDLFTWAAVGINVAALVFCGLIFAVTLMEYVGYRRAIAVAHASSDSVAASTSS